MDKINHIQNGDFIEHKTLNKIETSGPVEIAEHEGRKIVLIPGKKTPKVAVQEHNIKAVFRDGKEIIRFSNTMPELSAETKHILYYLLRDAMREGGELEDIFDSLYVDDVEAPLEGELLEKWAKIQKEVALFSGWCFQGEPPTERGRQ
jgi:hypothetical protein